MLFVNQLCFSRHEKTLFENLNFTLKAGDILQITGINGAGKTTLLKLLAGFVKPDTGQIYCEDRLAYLGHAPALTSWFTVFENIRLTAKLYGYPEEEAFRLLTSFYLTGQAGFLPHQLSCGQQKRAAFANLVLRRAKVWLLDEPFSSLDKETADFIRSLIQQHVLSKGLVVMSTHHKLSWASAELNLNQHQQQAENNAFFSLDL